MHSDSWSPPFLGSRPQWSRQRRALFHSRTIVRVFVHARARARTRAHRGLNGDVDEPSGIAEAAMFDARDPQG
ncbi:unnamed protein product [Lampetra fluviatilis]